LLDFYGGHDSRIYFTSLVAFSTSTLLIFWSLYKNKVGSKDVLVGILPCFLIIIYYDFVLFLGFANLVVYNLVSFTNQLKIQKKFQREIELRSIQLETQLLKRNIKPHFIMNTLTSLMEWMEQEPKTGIKFIEALAKKFRLLNEISAKRLIPVSSEIELCKSHLEIMSYRKGINYRLNANNLELQELVPPAIFHTVIENGITHNHLETSEVTFQISFDSSNGSKTYRIESPGKFDLNNEIRDGTGIKYIKARLQESFANRWEFTSEPDDQGWLTIIRINS